MLQGNPLLVTIDASGTVRTLELSAGVFSPIATQGGFAVPAYGPPYPVIGWADDEVLVIHQSGSSRFFTLHDVLMTQVANVSQNANGSGQIWRVGYSQDAKMAMILDGSATSTSARKMHVGNGALTPETHAYPDIVPNINNVAISPDGSKITGLSTTALANMLNPGMNQALSWPNSYPEGADIGLWEKTNKYLIAGKRGDTSVFVYKFEVNNTLTESIELSYGGQLLESIGLSKVGNLLAVGWSSGGVFTTILYRRLGGFYQAVQTLSNIGGLLSFSADSTILIDSVTKKAFKRNASTGQFDSADAMMVNVASGVVGQALSDHVPAIFSTVDYYQVGLNALTSTGLVASSLKYTLAADTAPAYNPDHATLSDVLGTAEVSSGNWPAGGVPLVNPSKTNANLAVSYLSDDISRNIVFGSVEFRYVILHQNGVPVLRHDMNQNITVADQDKLILDIPTSGVLFIAA